MNNKFVEVVETGFNNLHQLVNVDNIAFITPPCILPPNPEWGYPDERQREADIHFVDGFVLEITDESYKRLIETIGCE